MREKVKRAVAFWGNIAEEAEDNFTSLDRTSASFKRDVDTILERIPVSSGSRGLDLCCGNGLTSFFISKKAGRMTALDMSWPMLKKGNLMKKDKADDKVDFVKGEVFFLPFKDDSFDFTICLTSFHYFPDYHYAGQVLKEIFRVTKATGRIYLTGIPDKGCTGYLCWNAIRNRGNIYDAPLPQRYGKRGIVERINLLFRRFTGRRVDSDEWLWYRKSFFSKFSNEKFKTMEIFQDKQNRLLNYRFNVLITE